MSVVAKGDSMKQPAPETQSRSDGKRTFERPDGYWWEDTDSGEIFGPFTSLRDALNDMEYGTEPDIEVGETLAEAEDEIGISTWIDSETGEPAEEHPPHPGAE
jgi:hypothetical protein